VNHYCTYFDRGYLAPGVALWESLARHDPAAILIVLALDGETSRVLRRIGGDRVYVVDLAELLASDPELAALQEKRSRPEFIFSLTPCLIRFLLHTRTDLESMIYLDADLFFFAGPHAIWEELARGSVLVVPHRYPSWHDDSVRYGRFNVGVVGFRRDATGRACADWWRDQCLASTALTGDGVHYGDQKYLDEWPRRFAGVIESTHPGVNVAPWNWARHRFVVEPHAVRVDGKPLIVFHFAQFRRVSGGWFDSGQLEYGIMPYRLRSRLYEEYWTALLSAERSIRRAMPEFSISRRGWSASLGAWHLTLLRAFWGVLWLRVGPHWFAGRLGLGQFSGRVISVYRRWRRRAS